MAMSGKLWHIVVAEDVILGCPTSSGRGRSILTTHHHKARHWWQEHFLLNALGHCHQDMQSTHENTRHSWPPPVALPLRQHQRDCCGGEFLHFFSTCHPITNAIVHIRGAKSSMFGLYHHVISATIWRFAETFIRYCRKWEHWKTHFLWFETFF